MNKHIVGGVGCRLMFSHIAIQDNHQRSTCSLSTDLHPAYHPVSTSMTIVVAQVVPSKAITELLERVSIQLPAPSAPTHQAKVDFTLIGSQFTAGEPQICSFVCLQRNNLLKDLSRMESRAGQS